MKLTFRLQTMLLLTIFLAAFGGLHYSVWRAAAQDRALIAALKKQDARQAATLLAQGANPNARDETDLPKPKTPWYAHYLNLIPFRQKTSEEEPLRASTALMFAAAEGDTATMKLLLDRGATVNENGTFFWGRIDEDDFIMEDSPFRSAIRSNSPAAVRLLLAHGADVNAHEGDCGNTPLDDAHSEVVANPNNMSAKERQDLNAIIKLLKQAGAQLSQNLPGRGGCE